MRDLIERYIPHAPGHGLYVSPSIPDDKLRNALGDYAHGVKAADVIALYDATLLGSAKDGAVFTSEKIVFQNTDLNPAQEMRYDDIVGVSSKKRFLGGMKVQVDHNSGQATVTHTIDFSGKGDAAAYVARFLHEAMMARSGVEEDVTAEPLDGGGTDRAAVEAALVRLVATGRLTREDYETMMGALEE